MRALLVAAGMIVLATAGCGGTTTRPFVAGPYRRTEAELFARATGGARSHGYEVVDEDPLHGRFVVPAHTSGPRGQIARFVVQCYRPGWMQVTVEAPFVRRTEDRMSMNGNLYNEYRDFTLDLMAAIEPDQQVSGGEPEKNR